MNSLIERASTARAEIERLLIAEIIAGNTIVGTPMAVCGRVAFSLAYAVARSCINARSADASLAPVAQH